MSEDELKSLQHWAEEKIEFAEKEINRAINEIDESFYEGVKLAFEIVKRKLKGAKPIEEN